MTRLAHTRKIFFVGGFDSKNCLTDLATVYNRGTMVRRKNIGIVGLGYVGLPLALSCVSAGYHVFGVDIDQGKIESLSRGESYIEDVPSSDIKQATKAGLLSFSNFFPDVSKCSIVVICVPTPVDVNHDPDLSMLELAARGIAPHLQVGTLVISESTSYPGTLRNFIKPKICSNSSLRENEIFFAVAPERVDPGNKSFNHLNTPRIVGGLDEDSLILASNFYRTITPEVVQVSQPEVAEAAKMLENTFRQVNIALVNEFSKIGNVMKFDVHEAIEAASTKPYGFMKFVPGPGVGGHCIPVDPYYLTWISRQFGFTPELIEKANQVNREMPNYVVERFRMFHGESKINLRILIAGMAYKPGIADLRESPATQIYERLKELGYSVDWYDPVVESYLELPRANLGETFSSVIITLRGLHLPINEWLAAGTKIFDCTGEFREYQEIEQL